MNIQQMMKQAQVMQQRMEEMQERLGETEVEGSAGGGMVNVVMTCKGAVRKLTLNPEIIVREERETLEDLIVAALGMAKMRADVLLADETRKMMEEMGMPANMKLPL